MRLTPKEQLFFAQRLAFLVEGGAPLVEALSVMGRQVRSAAGKRVTESLRAEVASGHSLSDAMRRFPKAFGPEAVTLVSVGESCGTLGRNLQQLADELKKRRRLRRKVLGALSYPAVVLAATCAIVTYLLTSLLPKLMPVFASVHARLPASTRAVMATSHFLRAYGLWLLAAIASVVSGILWYARRDVSFGRYCEYALLRLPAFGPLLGHARLTQMSRSMDALLSSGLTVRDACLSCADSGGDGLYAMHARLMAETVNRGLPLSTHLLQHPVLFPELYSQMIAAGEQSGKLPEAFRYLADHHEKEVDEAANEMSTLLEPTLMLLTGATVGFIAIAVISPMYALTQSLHA